MKQIRISKHNEKALNIILDESGNSLLTLPRLANAAMSFGTPKARRHFSRRKAKGK